MGSRDKHIYVNIDDLHRELQDESGFLSTSWTEMSVRSRVRDLSEVTQRYKLSEQGQRALPFTRLANELCSRCTKRRKFIIRHIGATFVSVKELFTELDGASDGLTIGLEFITKTVWFDILIILKTPYHMLAIRHEHVTSFQEYTILGPFQSTVL